MLPTFAELGGAKVPETFPDRDPTPLAGVSLAPIIAGQDMPARPPIHLLFSSDRGLRDGQWKIVSFQSHPWELYDMTTDRTELHDLAAQHPEIVARMVKTWHEMSEKVLMTKGKELAPVDAEVTPQVNREWTDYDRPLTGGEAQKKKRKGKGKAKESSTLPRARKGTTLKVEGSQLQLHCTGEDPGLAFDRLAKIESPGPYILQFRMQSHASGAGEIFWTTDAETILPKGKHLEFEVSHDGEWHDYTLKIDDPETLHALRLDPCGGEGDVVMEGLVLKTADGKVLASWP